MQRQSPFPSGEHGFLHRHIPQKILLSNADPQVVGIFHSTRKGEGAWRLQTLDHFLPALQVMWHAPVCHLHCGDIGDKVGQVCNLGCANPREHRERPSGAGVGVGVGDVISHNSPPHKPAPAASFPACVCLRSVSYLFVLPRG